MPESSGEKQFQPTPRKLHRVRQQGRVPQSQEMGSAVVLMALLLVLSFTGAYQYRSIHRLVLEGIQGNPDVFTDSATFCRFAGQIVLKGFVLILPTCGVLLIAGVLASLLVGGATFSAQNIRFRWDAINPGQNLKQLFNLSTLVKLGLSIAKIVLICWIIVAYLWQKMDSLIQLHWTWSTNMLATISGLLFDICFRVALALLIVGLIDMFYQRWKFNQDLKMTHQEMKQERKDTEGSPEVRAKHRALRIRMLKERLKTEVPKADVVLVNPTHYAVAIRYDSETMAAPQVVAKGVDHLAEEIRRIARAYGIPIVRRPEVARTLYATVNAGQEIPEDLFTAVAEVLAMIYRLRQQKRR